MAAQPATNEEFQLSDDEFHEIRRVVHRTTGIALADTKRHLVYGRLARRLRALSLTTFREYLQRIEQDGDELEEFCNAITTNLTFFFREGHHFQHLSTKVLPDLLKQNAATRRIRIWSAGCSTGEEPYSIACCVQETLGNLRDWDVKILATDLDSKVLAHGQAGIYAADRLDKVDKARRDRWFVPQNGGAQWSAREELRRLISFKRLNLMEQWPVKGPFDVIFCRNVVIYFDKSTQRIVFGRFAELQRPGSHLFIGHSESLFNVCDRYELIGQTIYRKND
ncbi:MAG: protein-glutamate O-methyltransferase [Steroidobacteraceae bacterium]